MDASFHAHLANLAASYAASASKALTVDHTLPFGHQSLNPAHVALPAQALQNGFVAPTGALNLGHLPLPFSEEAMVIDRRSLTAYATKVAHYEQELLLLHQARVNWMHEREGLLEKITKMQAKSPQSTLKLTTSGGQPELPSNEEWASSFLHALASRAPSGTSSESTSALSSPKSNPTKSLMPISPTSAFTPVTPPPTPSTAASVPRILVSSTGTNTSPPSPTEAPADTSLLQEPRSNTQSKRKRAHHSDDEDSTTTNATIDVDDETTDDMSDDFETSSKRAKTTESSSFSSAATLSDALPHHDLASKMMNHHDFKSEALAAAAWHLTAQQSHALAQLESQQFASHFRPQMMLPGHNTRSLFADTSYAISSSSRASAGMAEQSQQKSQVGNMHMPSLRSENGAIPPPAVSIHNSMIKFHSDSVRRGHLPEKAIRQLKNWFYSHKSHPYPSEDEKNVLIECTGLSRAQINNWFTNARRRLIPRQ